MPDDIPDAYGHLMYDAYTGKNTTEVVERDDGYIDYAGGGKDYLRKFDEWPEIQREAMKFARGRVLDIGCGAGRHSLYLQERGFEVYGIDSSASVISVCRKRGLKNAHHMPFNRLSREFGLFDTILMLGNNLGLLENCERAKTHLKRLHRITTKRGRIIGESRDPYQTDIPEHLEYHEFNRSRGRMPGQLRIRIRYKKYKTPWFNYLLMSKEELEDILKNTGWAVNEYIDGKDGMYIAIIDKEESD
ncbi:MAG: methyltransferase domain-containing protein [Candidatus Eremiobacteraeota bacterium]|nr:methyltransferase domain-containing protein [Candidatus Eremiobacteraeota bacterium]